MGHNFTYNKRRDCYESFQYRRVKGSTSVDRLGWFLAWTRGMSTIFTRYASRRRGGASCRGNIMVSVKNRGYVQFLQRDDA